MAQNKVKVLPGWSAKDHYHLKVVEQEEAANCKK